MVVVAGQNASMRNAWYASLGLLFLMLLGGIVWYKQRMLFGDPAYISFRILNEKRLFIQEHRYGAAVTQIWPLIGGVLHLPLRVVLVLYSASFYLFYGVSLSPSEDSKKMPLLRGGIFTFSGVLIRRAFPPA